MSEFKPTPLASTGRFTKLSDLETNFRRVVQIVGGDAYNAGVLASSGGAMGVDQLKKGKWLTNDRKTEPYAAVAFQGYWAQLAPSTSATIAIPGLGFIKDAVGIEYGFAYGTVAGGANFSGTLAVDLCGTAAPTKTITTLVPFSLVTQSISATSWAPDEGQDGNFIRATLTNSSGGITISDCIITIAIKHKHIA